MRSARSWRRSSWTVTPFTHSSQNNYSLPVLITNPVQSPSLQTAYAFRSSRSSFPAQSSTRVPERLAGDGQTMPKGRSDGLDSVLQSADSGRGGGLDRVFAGIEHGASDCCRQPAEFH